jgi:hypothetical protein
MKRIVRKTIEVARLVEHVNNICKNSATEYSIVRQGAMNLLEIVLHETGNYRGFRYLREGECDGRPGINYLGEFPHPDNTLRFLGTDYTRIEYIQNA